MHPPTRPMPSRTEKDKPLFSMFERVPRREWAKEARKILGVQGLESLNWSYDPYLTLKPYYDETAGAPVFPHRLSRQLAALTTKNLLYWGFKERNSLMRLLPFCEGVIMECDARWEEKTLRDIIGKLAMHSPLIFRTEAKETFLSRLASLEGKGVKHPDIWLWATQQPLDTPPQATGHPRVRDLSIDLAPSFHRGAPPTLQVAYLSSQLAGLITHFSATHLGDLLDRLFLIVPTEPDYFHQIAKLRAIRWHVDRIITTAREKASNPAGDKTPHTLPVVSISGLLNRSFLSPQINMLRNTQEAMASLLGGTEALATLPFDLRTHAPGRRFFSHRMALHKVNILRHEAYIAVPPQDPVAGSYFLETLVSKMARRSWEIFRQICEKGGINTPEGRTHFEREMEDAAKKGRATPPDTYPLWVGINGFVKTEDTEMPSGADDDVLPTAYLCTYAGGKQKKTVFFFAPYEAIRRRSEDFFRKNPGKKPVVFIAPQDEKDHESIRDVFSLLGIESTSSPENLRALLTEKQAPPWIWGKKEGEEPPIAAPPPLFSASTTPLADSFFIPPRRGEWISTADKLQITLSHAIERLRREATR